MSKKKQPLEVEQLRQFLSTQGPDTKIYIGCDSVSFKKRGKWYAEFYSVVVVHKDGRHGCKIFGEIATEQDYAYNRAKPTYRLMQEAMKAADMFLRMYDAIKDFYCEVHLDLNPKEECVSYQVISQAVGYIKGMCGVTPLIKPNAFAASYAADRIGRVNKLGEDVVTVNG